MSKREYYALVLQKSIFLSHTNTSNVLEFKDYKNIDCKDDKDIVIFRFVDLRGYVAKYLVTGITYFPVVTQTKNGKTANYYMYATNNGKFTLDIKGLKDRLFLYLAPGTKEKRAIYKYRDNLTGSFFIHADELNKSNPANFGYGTTDLVRLVNPNSLPDYYQDFCEILAEDCEAKCEGKLCNEYNGCGLPCGCSDNSLCMLNGDCFDIQSKYREIINETKNRATPTPQAIAKAVEQMTRIKEVVNPPAIENTWASIYSVIIIIILLILCIIILGGIIYVCYLLRKSRNISGNPDFDIQNS